MVYPAVVGLGADTARLTFSIPFSRSSHYRPTCTWRLVLGAYGASHVATNVDDGSTPRYVPVSWFFSCFL